MVALNFLGDNFPVKAIDVGKIEPQLRIIRN